MSLTPSDTDTSCVDHVEQLCCDQGRFLDGPLDDGTFLELLREITRSDLYLITKYYWIEVLGFLRISDWYGNAGGKVFFKKFAKSHL